MLARVQSFLLNGIDDEACEVEVDIHEVGMPKVTVVGLPDTAVRESLERVKSAVSNCGYEFPDGRLLVNLAPADLRKEGPIYDLPIAVGLLIANGALAMPTKTSPVDYRTLLFAGELALDGRLRPINGAISLALQAKKRRCRGVVLPRENAKEAAAVDGIEVFGASTLASVVALLNSDGIFDGGAGAGGGDGENGSGAGGSHHSNNGPIIEPEPPLDIEALITAAKAPVDFAEIKGQEIAKRAMLIAAAGGHNIVMLGPAGTGKTMLAKALPGIIPPLTREEALEVTRIYSTVGLVGRGEGIKTIRPVRTPHHTASAPAIIGGGTIPRPGEVSLAHRGVLFLDELPEFNRAVLETLRQPLEDRVVTISRAHSTLKFPADFMLVAALNPTPKGDLPKGVEGQRAMERYLSRLSGPLIDRIDIHVEVPALPFTKLRGKADGKSSAALREEVLAARRRQAARQGENLLNTHLSGKMLDKHAALDEAGALLLGQAVSELGLSARAYDKVRRVARTIADLEGQAALAPHHVAEAVQYRLLDRML